MPGWLVLGIVFGIAGLIGLLVALIARATRHPDKNGAVSPSAASADTVLGWTIAASVLLFGAVAFTLASSWNPVGTKEEGIELSFGKTVGHLSNGPHMTWPWIKVKEMDAAIQTDSFTGKNCLSVRIANQQTGCASVSIQWRIQPNSADELYKDFRSFDHVRDALVTRKLTAAVNEAFAHYNPIAQIIAEGKKGSHTETLVQIASKITAIMRREVGGQIEVLSTILPLITFDDATQNRINQLQQQVALTAIATQQLQTNRKQAEANKALARSVNNSPNVLVARCLDALDAMIKAGQTVPAGFSCWPGSGVAGVIANTGTGGK